MLHYLLFENFDVSCIWWYIVSCMQHVCAVNNEVIISESDLFHLVFV
jgi:hypothetical protein